MAVEPQQVLMVESTLSNDTDLVSDNPVKEEDGEVSADILQQALQEATEDFDQASAEYDNVENAVAVVHGVHPEEDEPEAEQSVELDVPLTESESQNENINNEYLDNSQTATATTTTSPSTGTVRVLTAKSIPHGLSTRLNSQAPIGSSQNPIQIIQQGNTYHSTQVLSQEQLQQIAQVLQQQQQISQMTPNGGTSVLYNAATNTRIVYRIIYPSELHSKGPKNTTTQTSLLKSSVGKGRGRPRKPWGKRFEDSEERVESPEMSREEKEAKKKHRPRTRSGRISKPPKYMVKDYKRIHHLDFDDEPYDDSDGGYSDYRVSGEDDDNSRSSTSSILPQGVTTSKPRSYKCVTCDKAYIGRGGLSRHYRLFPTHGNADEIEAEANASNSASLDGLPGSGPATPASIGGSQASNDGSVFASSTVTTTTATTTLPTNTSAFVKRGRGRPSNFELASLRRKTKLKDLVKHCDNEELMETVLPCLAKVVSVWEFLLMKCEKGSPPKPKILDICKELESLLKQAQKMAQEFLTFIPETDSQKFDKEYLQISNVDLAQAMKIATGTYEIKENKSDDSLSFRYKMLTTDPSEINRNQTTRRTVEVVAPEEMVVQSPLKKRRLENFSVSKDDKTVPSQSSSSVEEKFGMLPEEILQENQETTLDFESLRASLEPESISNKQSTEPVSIICSDSQTEPSNTQETEMECNNPQSDLADLLTEASPTTDELENKIESSEVQQTSVMCESDYVTTEGVMQEITEKPDSDTKEIEYSSENTEMPVSIVNEENGENIETETPMQLVCTENTTISIEDNETGIIRLPVTEDGTSQFITQDGQLITALQDGNGQAILGQVICQSNEDGEVIRQVMIQDGQILNAGHLEGLTDLTELSSHAILPSNVVILQNADGTTTALQLPPDQTFPLETVQALLSMDADTRAQILNTQSTQMTEDSQ